MKILLTGGTGFVGKNLLQALKNEFEILFPGHRELDLLDYQAVEKYISDNQISAVVHSAVHSTHQVSREDGFEQDLRMWISILRCKHLLAKIIFFGSGAEFAKTRDMKKIKEASWGELIPPDLYGFSKYLIQQTIEGDPKLINLRLFGVYGPYEDYRFKFISNAIVKNMFGLQIKIKQDVIFDYLYIKDLAPIVKHFLLHPANYNDYNITPNNPISLSQVVQLINQISDRQSEVEIMKPGYNFEYSADNQRLKAEIAKLKFHSYQDGISDLMKYYHLIKMGLDKSAIVKDEYLQKAKTKV